MSQPHHVLSINRGRDVSQLLLAPIPPSHKVEGHCMNYGKQLSYKGKPVECTLLELKTNV